MCPPSPEADRVASAIAAWRGEGRSPLVVAIDGYGSAGKSTLVARLRRELIMTVVSMDDFLRDPGADRAGSATELAAYYDWARLRREALEPLLAGQTVAFRAFDWQIGGLRPERVTLIPSELIVLEGVSSTDPALGDLVDHSVLVTTSEDERLQRARRRIPAEIWDEDWLAAERSYFAARAATGFDLVVSGAGGHPGVRTP
jgi:uridine kinase